MKRLETHRKQFPALTAKMRGKSLIYLDNAATTQKPLSVIEAESKYYKLNNANVHRAVYELSENSTLEYDKARAGVARFVNAEMPEEIIFTGNATMAINVVAASFSRRLFGKRRKILLTAMEHHSNILPWRYLAKREKLSLDFVEITSHGMLDIDDLKKKIKGAAFLAFTHVSNVLGTINPAMEICSIAKKEGALTLLDAAQSAGHLSLDARKIGADFIVFSGHKMYGPMGIGVLYGKRQILEKMEPAISGGGMVKEVTRDKVIWADLPGKFEAGTPNIAGAAGLLTAIEFLEKIGMSGVARHERTLTNYALKKMGEINEVKILGAGDKNIKSGIISFTIDGVHSHDLASLLDRQGIAIRSGQHCAQPLLTSLGLKECARISFSVTTTEKEIDKFIDNLRKSIKILK